MAEETPRRDLPHALHHVFLSYASFDREEVVPKFAQALQDAFRSITGQPLRIFFDVRDIQTADVWEERIRRALESSIALVAVLTPSYFTSEWCAREWDHFVGEEASRRRAFGLGDQNGLIFPVKLLDCSKALLSSDQRLRLEAAERRQHVSLEDVPPDDAAFRLRVRELASSLVDVVRVVERVDEGPPGPGRDGFDRGDSREPARIETRIGSNRQEFVERLAEATHVTIVGLTHVHLVEYLEEALRLKEEREEGDAFWQSIRVVFVSEPVLALVDDELVREYPDREHAARQRARSSGRAKRELSSFFLRADRPRRWQLYEYGFMLPFVGALFQMADGRQFVQVATHRPAYAMSEYLYLELSDVSASELAYYRSAFEAVVDHSAAEDEVVVIGRPQDQAGRGFFCERARFRRSVLHDGANTTDWIPVVLVVLWHRDAHGAHPLLAVNTPENSTRELGRLSHPSGYINLRDCEPLDPAARDGFLLTPAAVETAVRRELGEELALTEPGHGARPVGTARFLYPEKENLYFHVYELEVDEAELARFPPGASIRPWPLETLLEVRAHQVVSTLRAALVSDQVSGAELSTVAEIAAHNLTLHGLRDLGARLLEGIASSARERLALAEELERLARRYEHRQLYRGTPMPISGLAGMQYREFFTQLIPTYAQLGVPGAADCLRSIDEDETMSTALEQLRQAYQSEDSIASLAVEI